MRRKAPFLYLPIIFLLSLFIISSITVYANNIDCSNGKHNDIIINENENSITYQCSFCFRQYTDHLNNQKHQWSQWFIDKKPTCTGEGLRHKTCLLHSPHDEYEIILPLTHKYTVKTKEPTCSNLGVKTYICTLCADNYSEEYGELQEHCYSENVTQKATCTSDGEIVYTCENCTDIYTDKLPIIEHQYGGWVIDKEAKAGIEGSRHKDCKHNCGNKIIENIPALKSTLVQENKTPQKVNTFNTADLIISSVNLAAISFFMILLTPMGSVILWEHRKCKENLIKFAETTKEANPFDYN